MIYPGGTPEFRILLKPEGQVLQVRYLKSDVGYVGKWQDVPIIKEE